MVTRPPRRAAEAMPPHPPAGGAPRSLLPDSAPPLPRPDHRRPVLAAEGLVKFCHGERGAVRTCSVAIAFAVLCLLNSSSRVADVRSKPAPHRQVGRPGYLGLAKSV